MADTLRVEDATPVISITLTRPERRNAFDAALIHDLTAAFRAASDTTGARVVVLAGEGKSFSAGADLDWMRASLALSREENERDALALADLFAAIATCPLPVVARVHGHALGGGAGLVCAADIAIASSDASIGFPEVRLGIIPAAISPYVVRRIGPGAARALFLTGRPVDARRALALGLVHDVVEADELDAAVARTVADLNAGGRNALAATKRLLDETTAPLAPGVREETARRIAGVRVGDEAQARLAAFVDRPRT
jgi:methylglutaconyl-CoA hydratase